jgi:hypothetical protein
LELRVIKAFSFLSLLVFSCLSAFASDSAPAPTPPSAEVIKLIGKVTLDDTPLKVGDIINKRGMITTSDKSYIQFKIDKWKNNISIGANSKMDLNFSDEKKYTLEKGHCRWKSFAPSEVKGKIFTKNSALGVRGTDFLLKFNSTFGETEVIMFDGAVFFENSADKSNAFEIKKGQWGGIGGRFGQKMNPPLDLPKEVLDTMERTIE